MSGPSDELRNLRSSSSSASLELNQLSQVRELTGGETKEVYIKRIQLEINGNSIDGIEHIETKGYLHNNVILNTFNLILKIV